MPDEVSMSGQTDKLCPFQTITINGSDAIGIRCIKDACQLWVKNDNASGDAFTTVAGCNNMDGVVTPGSDAEDNQGRCGMQLSDFVENIFRINHHQHRHHQHSKGHLSCATIPSGCGDAFYGNSIPKSMKLLMEYDSFEDQDGNGKIFGKDFTILQDENTPPSMMGFTSPPNVPTPVARVRWDDILNDKFPPYIKFIKPSKVSKDGGMWVKVYGAFFSGDTNLFEVKIGKPDEDIPYVNITSFVIKDFNTMYFKTPSFSFTEETLLDIYMKNVGDTFDFPVTSLIFNSGGESVFKNILKIKMEPDDAELKAEHRQEVLDLFEDGVPTPFPI